MFSMEKVTTTEFSSACGLYADVLKSSSQLLQGNGREENHGKEMSFTHHIPLFLLNKKEL